MCELFGFSAKHPLPGAAVPLGTFGRHGGAAADNPDGWGVAWRRPELPTDWQLEKEPCPAWNSPRFADLIATVPLTSDAGWTAFEPGELRIYRAGACVGRIATHPPAPHNDPELVTA